MFGDVTIYKAFIYAKHYIVCPIRRHFSTLRDVTYMESICTASMSVKSVQMETHCSQPSASRISADPSPSLADDVVLVIKLGKLNQWGLGPGEVLGSGGSPWGSRVISANLTAAGYVRNEQKMMNTFHDEKYENDEK